MNLPFCQDSLNRTLLSTYHATLAVFIIRIRKTVFIYGYTPVRAPGNACHALGAFFIIPYRPEQPPVSCLSHRCAASGIYGRAGCHGWLKGDGNNRASLEYRRGGFQTRPYRYGTVTMSSRLDILFYNLP